MKADIIHGRLVITPESISEETLLNQWKDSALTNGYFNMDRNQNVYQIGEYSIDCRKLSDRFQSHESDQDKNINHNQTK